MIYIRLLDHFFFTNLKPIKFYSLDILTAITQPHLNFFRHLYQRPKSIKNKFLTIYISKNCLDTLKVKYLSFISAINQGNQCIEIEIESLFKNPSVLWQRLMDFIQNVIKINANLTNYLKSYSVLKTTRSNGLFGFEHEV